MPQDTKILTWNPRVYHLDREYVWVNPAYQSVLDFGLINDSTIFLKRLNELSITHLLYDRKDVPFTLYKHTKEFLDKCISELLEGGKITLIKHIDSCTIYAVAPSDDFILDVHANNFYD